MIVLWRCGRQDGYVEEVCPIIFEFMVLTSRTTSPYGSTSPNPFVQTTLLYVLTFLEHIPSTKYQELSITILADNDYYSNPGTVDSTKATHGKQFKSFGVPLTSAHKTGLGSSAALVTALTTSLLEALAKDFKVSENQARIHNLAQAAHCAAQGKVGSGFDVAAAVYGSCLYRRFTPSILERVGEPGREGFGERLHQCVEDLLPDAKWDVEVQKDIVKVPQNLRLVMCDVDCGSQTPGMVKKVLAWRKEKPAEADVLWAAIQQGAEDLCIQLSNLSLTDTSLSSATDYQGLRDTIETIRSFVREMSDKSQVPIEPKVQTELLDACAAVSGVIGGVVPGAGGYDAIALLVQNDDRVVQQLQGMLQGWDSTVKEEDTTATIGKVRLLDVKQEFEGVRQEVLSQYQGWL